MVAGREKKRTQEKPDKEYLFHDTSNRKYIKQYKEKSNKRIKS